MIKKSFIFLDKVGAQSERNIWSQGIRSWEQFLGVDQVKGVSNKRKGHYDRKIKTARRELYDYNSEYFTDILPKSETWRLFDFFKDDVVYLDIETSGYYGDITVIGLFDGYDTKTMVKGQNLSKKLLKDAFLGKKLLVTFNGQSFDIPVINRYFKGVIPKIPHLDLRFPLAKLGYSGGLKAIEKKFGIKRPDEISDCSGEDAVYLWQMYNQSGDKKFLNRLVKYNEEDIVNLQPLAKFVSKGMKKFCFD